LIGGKIYSELKSFSAMFSTREDRHLVQLAAQYEDRGTKVSWVDIAGKMKYAKKEPRVLQRRIVMLKQTHGKVLRSFPSSFFLPPRANERETLRKAREVTRNDVGRLRMLLPMPPVTVECGRLAESNCTTNIERNRQQETAALIKPATQPQHIRDHILPRRTVSVVVPTQDSLLDIVELMITNMGHHTVQASASLLIPSQAKLLDVVEHQITHVQHSTVLHHPDTVHHSSKGNLLNAFEQLITHESESASVEQSVQSIIDGIFQTVTKADVNQHGARLQENVGELSVSGVSALLAACNATTSDVFVDVGSGIGNVVVQVALETAVSVCIGVEVRVSIARLGSELIRANANKYPRTNKVVICPQDICKVDITARLWQQATILFCHNTLFEGSTMVALEALCCKLPALRIVILQQPFCHRHSQRCTREFCTLFTRRDSIMASVHYTSSIRAFHVFDRGQRH